MTPLANLPPPLILEHYHVTELAVTCEPPGDVELPANTSRVAPAETTAEVTVESADGSPDLYRVRMKLSAGSPDLHYRVGIRVDGYFTIVPDFPAEERLRLLRVNGASMLYGAMRDFVQTVTGRCVLPALVLPTLRFVDADVTGD